jgi:hypothetical protein
MNFPVGLSLANGSDGPVPEKRGNTLPEKPQSTLQTRLRGVGMIPLNEFRCSDMDVKKKIPAGIER